MDFYDLEPHELMALSIDTFSQNDLRELAYFIWSVYPEDESLMLWRKESLLPKIKFTEQDFNDD